MNWGLLSIPGLAVMLVFAYLLGVSLSNWLQSVNQGGLIRHLRERGRGVDAIMPAAQRFGAHGEDRAGCTSDDRQNHVRKNSHRARVCLLLFVYAFPESQGGAIS